ncbi:hypothetical protein YC2023_094873 [Brassica napus]
MVYVLTQDMLLIHYNLEQKKRHFYQHINSNTHRSSSVVRLLIALLAESNFSEQTDRQKENPKMDGHDSEDSSKQSTADMTAFFFFFWSHCVFQQTRFQTMSDSIITKNIPFHQSMI